MAKKLSPGSTDRPPTILSPHGEGYCRWCQFVVGLGSSGLLAPHVRGKNGDRWCPGSDTTPPKVTPYSSRKAMFRVAPKTARGVPTAWISGVQVYAQHRLSPSVVCDWRFRVVVTD